MKTVIVWFRNDLRIADNPALHAACQQADVVIPVFVLENQLLKSPNRSRFLRDCLEDLHTALQRCGSGLHVLDGPAEEVLPVFAKQVQASGVYFSTDYSPFARRRDAMLTKKLNMLSIDAASLTGKLAVESVEQMRTKTGSIYKVFTPFYNNWLRQPRRPILHAPTSFNSGSFVANSTLITSLPAEFASPAAQVGGETAALKHLHSFIDTKLRSYRAAHNNMAADATSRLSSYLHFGALSVRTIEAALPHTDDAIAFQRQLAWRDFYHYILFHFPETKEREFQEQYKALSWNNNNAQLEAWKQGKTGYPVVDAAMRQLLEEGWMHNRARLIVGSFLTKDLGIDWREGEKHFQQWLLDGDQANNIGNWQWIASVGVDPAPLFRRLYNPVSQHKSYDPESIYVKKYVPELRNIPPANMYEPWKMSQEQQVAGSCMIGTDYPAPIVDHALARQETLERYKAI